MPASTHAVHAPCTQLQNFIMSALVPAYQFRSYVEQHPQKSGLPALQQELQRVAHSMVLQERRQVGKQLKWVEVTFQGRMVLVEPQDHPDASTILQYDLLRPQPLLPLSVRTDAVTALRTLKLVMQGVQGSNRPACLYCAATLEAHA